MTAFTERIGVKAKAAYICNECAARHLGALKVGVRWRLHEVEVVRACDCCMKANQLVIPAHLYEWRNHLKRAPEFGFYKHERR